MDALRQALEIARAEAGYRASRSSGPGGQHAQKNETRIEAFLELDSCSLDEATRERLRERFGRTVRAVSQDERSQLRNRELALMAARAAAGKDPRCARAQGKAHRHAALALGDHQAPDRKAAALFHQAPAPSARRRGLSHY